jgi:hypothetical protein
MKERKRLKVSCDAMNSSFRKMRAIQGTMFHRTHKMKDGENKEKNKKKTSNLSNIYANQVDKKANYTILVEE